MIPVLVLAGTELVFFTGAVKGLCFGFVLETVVIIQRCIVYFWSAQSPAPLCSSLTARSLGMHKEWGGDTAGIAEPQ